MLNRAPICSTPGDMARVGSKPATNSERGMTVLELLVACALATLLMVAVSRVLGSLSAQHKFLVSEHDSSSWRRQLAEQLDWDLSNSRRISCGPQEILLEGYSGRDFSTGSPAQRPVIVSYQARQNGRQAWLSRTETHVDDPGIDNERTELVCVGVVGMEVHRLDRTEEYTDPTQWAPLPQQLRLVLWGPSQNESVLDRVFLTNPFPGQ